MTKVLQIMAGAEVGGAEEFFLRLLPALGRIGIEQRAIIRRNARRETILRASGIPTTTSPFNAWLDYLTTRNVRREVKRFSPDIVLSWMSRASKFCCSGSHILVARLGGYYDLKHYRHCDHLIGNTIDIRNYIIKHGWPQERAWYIPNFVEGKRAPAISRELYKTPTEVPLLIALGRLHKHKAFEVLISALTEIPDAYLWIGGVGPLESKLRSEAEAYHVGNRVRFIGWRNDIPALLATADILVCPSRHEPLGNVVIEGWAHGIPVVATNTVGPRNLIHHDKTGLLVPVDDKNSLAEAINQIINIPGYAVALASQAYRAYETTFTENIVVKQYQTFFEEVIP